MPKNTLPPEHAIEDRQNRREVEVTKKVSSITWCTESTYLNMVVAESPLTSGANARPPPFAFSFPELICDSTSSTRIIDSENMIKPPRIGNLSVIGFQRRPETFGDRSSERILIHRFEKGHTGVAPSYLP